MRHIDNKPVVRFTNDNKNNRRETLKKFQDASYLRNQLDVKEDMEHLENDPMNNQQVFGSKSEFIW